MKHLDPLSTKSSLTVSSVLDSTYGKSENNYPIGQPNSVSLVGSVSPQNYSVPLSKSASVTSITNNEPNSEVDSIPKHNKTSPKSPIWQYIGWPTVIVLIILTGSTLLQNFSSTHSSTSFTVEVRNVLTLSYHNESTKPDKYTKP